MKRNFTMQRSCKFCRMHFTITSSNHWFCGFSDCTRRRRKADRDSPIHHPVQHDELGRDADGDVSIDWQTAGGDMLTMSLSEEGRLAWAIHYGDEKAHGTAQLDSACFKLLNELVGE